MATKKPRRTAERILEVTLELFNRFGEPNVSTTLISAELNISPGNLYYHYPAKDELINSLFDRYEKALNELLQAAEGVRNIDEVFAELIALSKLLSEEQTRHVREHLSEAELTIFDILTRPAPELSTEEREEVRKVARVLLERLHALLVIGWRDKVSARARVREDIKDALDAGLPRAYSKDAYQAKCDAVFDHVFRSYRGDGGSVFG